MPDPRSARSDRRGYQLAVLSAEGYAGPVPDFPLPAPSARELDVWAEAWRTPQASAWASPSELWRLRTIGMWVRVSVRCEDPKVSPTLLSQVHRFAEQIGMTTSGLAAMGWRIAAAEEKPVPVVPARVSARRRLRVAE